MYMFTSNTQNLIEDNSAFPKSAVRPGPAKEGTEGGICKTVSGDQIPRELEQRQKKQGDSYQDFVWEVLANAYREESSIQTAMDIITERIQDFPVNKDILYGMKTVRQLKKAIEWGEADSKNKLRMTRTRLTKKTCAVRKNHLSASVRQAEDILANVLGSKQDLLTAKVTWVRWERMGMLK